MERPSGAPERRLPRAVTKLRRDAIRLDFAVALTLALSIFALIYALSSVDTSFAEVVRSFASGLKGRELS
jgi:hypothetical protein